MHSRGFAHLDLKHENILLDDTYQPKIANFRFTRHTNGQLVYLRQSTKDKGAPEALEYLAPLDGMRVDIYCLGLVFYSTLTCKYPERHNIEARWDNQNFSTEIKDLID